jgi:hypothetical protein
MGNCSQCPRNGGYAGGFPVIAFDGLMEGFMGIANIIHELGHGFDSLFWDELPIGTTLLPSSITWHDSGLPGDSTGFALRISDQNTSTELFADMFLGWVTGEWASDNVGVDRSNWMTTQMDVWIY